MLKVKGTVRPRSLVITAALINAALELDLEEDMLITSGHDGKHMAGSLHYQDRAIDFRTKHLTAYTKRALVAAMKTRLGKDYQVILEHVGELNEHGHCEHDPAAGRRKKT